MSNSQNEITFFAWSDTHFGYEQKFASSDFRWDIIEQMNHLPGWPFPESIGGTVAEPEFVVHLGDFVDGGRSANLELGTYDYFRKRLRFPQHEVLGNHDMAFPEAVEQFVSRHGALSYSFDCGGFHFVSLCIDCSEHGGGAVNEAALNFLREDLGQLSAQTVTVMFVHIRLDHIHNGNEVLELLKDRNVVLLMSGHLHKPAVSELDGISCLDVGHCRDHPIDAKYGRSICVVRLTETSITAVPWRWDFKDWESGQCWPNPSETADQFILTRDLK